MNHNYDELIAGKLFVGSADEAQTAIDNAAVSRVFDVRVNGRSEEVPYNYTHCPIEEDDEAVTIKQGATQIATSIQTGEQVYIHCGSGTGRAAVMAAATLMELGQAPSVEEAMAIVKERRAGARFQPQMVAALEELYK